MLNRERAARLAPDATIRVHSAALVSDWVKYLLQLPRRLGTVAMHVVMFVALSVAVVPSTNVAVVCPPVFREAMGPWTAYRARQGYRTVWISAEGSAETIRRRIVAADQRGGIRVVVLVGDSEPGCEANLALRERCVPTFHQQAVVNVHWGSEPHLATDNRYADLDDDGVPELAVGRLTADSPNELREMIRKTILYESSTDFGPWRRRLNVVAGVGGFGPLADLVLQSTTRYLLTSNVPPQYDVTMTYASWRSPFCPDPRLFHQSTIERLTEGCLFWVYIGHGYHLGLDRVRVPEGHYHILGNGDVPKLRCRHQPPIALFLACYTGAFDATEDCLAEAMLRAPGGPVAILAGSRVTMPYAMAVMGSQLTEECFRRQTPTLGEAVLHAKQNLANANADDGSLRAMLDSVASALSPNAEKLNEERAEHVRLFNLFGDPLLRLKFAQEIDLAAPASVSASESVELMGESPVAGRLTVELTLRRDRMKRDVVGRQEYPTAPEELARLQEVYQKANERRLAVVERRIQAGAFRIEMPIPEEARGPCVLRVFVEGDDGFAAGAAAVDVEAP